MGVSGCVGCNLVNGVVLLGIAGVGSDGVSVLGCVVGVFKGCVW